MEVSFQPCAPAALRLEGPRYPLNRRLGGTKSLSGRFLRIENCLPMPGVERWTVQFLAVRRRRNTKVKYKVNRSRYHHLPNKRVTRYCCVICCSLVIPLVVASC